MHPAARAYIEEQAANRKFRHVVEFGGRNINGTIRDLFDCIDYTAVDLTAGAGVDVVADAASWRPERPVDAVVCCEVLEHTPNASGIVFNASHILEPGGHLFITCATDPRAPHSATDGGPLGEGEWYGNVDPGDFVGWLQAAGFGQIRYRVLQEGDLQAVARKCG